MARTNLFVDTNVFLNFYSYAKDDLGQLRKLIENIDGNGIVLHLPEHVLNELERNREAKLKASADQFKKESFPTAIPRHMQDYSHAQVYLEAVNTALKARVSMINQAATEASSKALAADKALEELVGKAHRYEDEDAIFASAMQRMQKGNPPGKSGSVGDQYHWEFLLNKLPSEDLHIVSKDGDYFSELNTGRPHPFLEKEWKQKKNANLHVYSELRPFIDRYLASLEGEIPSLTAAEIFGVPEVVIAQEATREPASVDMAQSTGTSAPARPVAAPSPEKATAIDALVRSGSFSETHAAISKLDDLRATLTTQDAETLLTAAVKNNQISWIASDSDVYAFFSELLSEHLDVNQELSDAAAEVFGLLSDEEDLDPS
ncbi:putative nucleic acid-binding protein [Oxalobacteraceae bacterium GrIS 1.11]